MATDPGAEMGPDAPSCELYRATAVRFSGGGRWGEVLYVYWRRLEVCECMCVVGEGNVVEVCVCVREGERDTDDWMCM